jgi:hypothetical protein
MAPLKGLLRLAEAALSDHEFLPYLPIGENGNEIDKNE